SSSLSPSRTSNASRDRSRSSSAPCAASASSAPRGSPPSRRVSARRGAAPVPQLSGERTLAQGAAPLVRLLHVVDLVWKPHPRMSSLLPDRLLRRREGRIGERAYRDGHKAGKYLFLDVEDRRATVRTEVEDALSTVRDAGVPMRNALDRHLLCVEK